MENEFELEGSECAASGSRQGWIHERRRAAFQYQPQRQEFAPAVLHQAVSQAAHPRPMPSRIQGLRWRHQQTQDLAVPDRHHRYQAAHHISQNWRDGAWHQIQIGKVCPQGSRKREDQGNGGRFGTDAGQYLNRRIRRPGARKCDGRSRDLGPLRLPMAACCWRHPRQEAAGFWPEAGKRQGLALSAHGCE